MTPALRHLHRLAAALAVALALPLAACGSSDDEPYVEASVETLYNNGMDLLLQDQLAAAARVFGDVERQHPYSVWATKSQLMAAYAHYKAGDYQDAINALDRFIQLHPGNRDVVYAYYLRALSFYEQISDVKRDQKMSQQALASLQEVVRRFPDSEYSVDAQEKLDLVFDHLAGKEMDIGRYYLQQRQYLAAMNRFKTVVEEYQTTSHTPEALHRLVECYMALGLVEEARRTASVLGFNYPDSNWYEDSYQLVESGASGRGRSFLGIF